MVGNVPEAILARAKNLVPADPVLEEIYLRSCVSCHAVADTIAPLTGDRELETAARSVYN